MKLTRMVSDEKIRLLFEELADIKEGTYKRLLEVYEALSTSP